MPVDAPTESSIARQSERHGDEHLHAHHHVVKWRHHSSKTLDIHRGKKWKMIAKLGMASALQGDAAKARIKQEMKTAGGGAKTEVKTEAELAALPFWMQGDSDLYTTEAIETRAALRKSPEVIAELQQWWETAQRSMQSGADASASELAKDEYILVSRKLSKVMLEEWSDDIAQELALEVRPAPPRPPPPPSLAHAHSLHLTSTAHAPPPRRRTGSTTRAERR